MTELQKSEEKKNQVLTPIQQRWQEAQYLAQSNLLPKHFAGNPANVLIALEYASQLSTVRKNLSPISVMQNLYVVHGNCGLSSKFMIALANSSGVFDFPIRYHVEGVGDKMTVKAYTEIKGAEISYTISMETAKAEGWTKNPKYKNMPELMLSYRAATFLIRLNAPEVVMGLSTDDDVRDAEYSENVNMETAVSEEVPALTGDIIDEDLL